MEPCTMEHIDAGLVNTNRTSHINAAVQAILHSRPMLKFLGEDSLHQAHCRSMLQCLSCAFYRLLKSMNKSGVGDPTVLVRKWQVASSRKAEAKKTDPRHVLSCFIGLLRKEHVDRNPEKNSFADISSHQLSVIWYSVIRRDVACSSCGVMSRYMEMPVIELNEPVSNIEKSIIHKLWGPDEDECPHCMAKITSTSTPTIRLADCLIVHLERRAADFLLAFRVVIGGVTFDLRSVMMKPDGVQETPCKYISICPDGLLRKFEDTMITLISPAKLCSEEFLQTYRLTLLYEKKMEKQLSKVTEVKNLKSRNDKMNSYKIMSLPDLSKLSVKDDGRGVSSSFVEEDEDDPGYKNLSMDEDIPSPSHINLRREKDICHGSSIGKTDASTQTSVQELLIEVGVQTLPYYSYETCQFSEKFDFFTGLTVEDFQALYNLIGGNDVISSLKLSYKRNTPMKLRTTTLTSEDKLFMFMLRLRRGLPLEELSEMFRVSLPSVSTICYAMMRLIYLTLKGMEDKMFPTAAAQRKGKPEKMRPFKNLRILMDGVSFYIQTPSNFEQQGNTYSMYKKNNVLVFTVGIACNGATIFCSEGMEGSMSDKQVVLKSGLLNRLTKGDGVMTDKGYELTAEFKAIGCHFYKPPMHFGDFTAEEEILTKAIDSARIYTEHAMADIKDHRLLQGVIPLTMLPVISNLVYIAAYLRNFAPRRIHDKAFVVKPNDKTS